MGWGRAWVTEPHRANRTAIYLQGVQGGPGAEQTQRQVHAVAARGVMGGGSASMASRARRS